MTKGKHLNGAVFSSNSCQRLGIIGHQEGIPEWVLDDEGIVDSAVFIDPDKD